MYAPLVQSATPRSRYKYGQYEAVFLEKIVAEGPIEYEFIIVVIEQGATDPFLFVTSERNDPAASAKVLEEMGLPRDMISTTEGESHFLCVFDKSGHHNLGDSNDWGDAEKFEVAALEILTQRLGGTPVTV